MLEVDLHPDRDREKKKTEGGLLSAVSGLSGLELGAPDWLRLRTLRRDPWTLALIAAAVLVVGAVGTLWWTQSQELEEVRSRVNQAMMDSIRYSTLGNLADSLHRERRAVEQRIDVVSRLDRGRYVWPHLLDELSRHLPGRVWLTGVERASPMPDLAITVRGRAADPLSVTTYVRNLEEARHVGEVEIRESSRTEVSGTRVHAFTLTLRYRSPPPSEVQTEPLVAQGSVGGGG